MATDSFFPKQKNIITVEIGEKYYKCVYFQTLKRKKEITSAKMSYDAKFSEKDIIQGIKDFTGSLKINNPGVISIIPSKFGIFKNIEVPSTDTKEIKQIIDLQAGAHTPYPKNEIVMGYTDIGLIEKRYTKILLVIVRRDVITGRYDIIKKAGYNASLAVLAPEVMSKAFFKLCPDNKNDKPIGIVHADVTSTDFVVVQRSKSVYMRSISVGMCDVKTKPDETKKLFLEELKKSLESYQANNIAELPEKIYLTGVEDWSLSMVEDVKQVTGKEVISLSYLDLAHVPASVVTETKNNSNISLFPAIALPIVEDVPYLNLVPDDIKVSQEVKKRSGRLLRLGISMILVLVLFCAALLTDVLFKYLYLEKLQKSYAKENMEVQKLDEISERTGVIKKLLRRKGRAISVLSELFDSIPKEAYLSSVTFQNDDTLIFTGTAGSMSMVFSFVTKLENSKFFKNVKVDFTKSRRQKNKEVADFGLTLTLE